MGTVALDYVASSIVHVITIANANANALERSATVPYMVVYRTGRPGPAERIPL